MTADTPTPDIGLVRYLGMTTVDDCMGYPPDTNPNLWCIYDTSEDDPPIVEGPEWECQLVLGLLGEQNAEIERLQAAIKDHQTEYMAHCHPHHVPEMMHLRLWEEFRP